MHDWKILVIVGGAAAALVIIGLLRSRPVDWAQRIGNLLPGWPWW